MKKMISQLLLAALILSSLSCSKTTVPQWGGFSIKLAVASLAPTSVTIVATASDSDSLCRFYVTPKADYRTSVIPESAESFRGNAEFTVTDLDPTVNYYAVAALKSGYSSIKEFNTSSAVGSLDPKGHPEDFNIVAIPTKQSRSSRRGVFGAMATSSDPAKLGAGVSWNYDGTQNYPSYATSLYAGNMAFYPMVSGTDINKSDITRIQSSYPQNGWIFGYNEPNSADGANMTPTAAAASWEELRTFAKGLGMSLSSPVLSSNGTLPEYGDPVSWLDKFVSCDKVGNEAFDAVALHCFVGQASDMREILRCFDKYSKPLYITEFCHFDVTVTNDEEKQISYMSDALNLLETDSAIGGYSWFKTRASGNWEAISLFNDDAKKPALTPLGKLYVNFSSFDKNCFYTRREPIPAAHYSSCNLSDASHWENTVKVRPCTDDFGALMTQFDEDGVWTEYQVEVSEDGTYALAARYSGDGAKMALSIDGGEAQTVEFPASSQWGCKWVEGLKLSKGRHTLRLGLQSGRVDLNWLYLD